MATVKTLKVILKGEEWTFTHKYLVYDDITLNNDDPTVQKCISDAKNCINLIPDDEEVKCSMVSK